MISESISITKVAKETGVSPRVLRHYANTGLIEADQRSGNKKRVFDVKIIQIVLDIKCFLEMGLTLNDVGIIMDKKMINTSDFKVSQNQQSKRQILNKIKSIEVSSRKMYDKYNY